MVYDSVYEANKYLRGTTRKQHFWEYFSGSKLQEATALLYSDNFTSNNFDYTNANGKFSYSSGKLNFDITSNSGTARAYKQLSSSLGSSDWELLYTVKFDSFTVGGNTTGLSIGVASNNTGTSNAYHAEYAFDGGARYNYLIANSQGNYSTTLFWNSGTEYFIRMKVTASTGKSDYVAYTSASDRSAGINPVANSTITKTPSTPPTTLMNYLVVKNERPTNGGSGDGYIKDITINRDTGTKWRQNSITGTGTYAMADSIDGGFVLTAGAGGSDLASIDFNDIRQFSPTASTCVVVAKSTASKQSSWGMINTVSSGIHGIKTVINSTNTDPVRLYTSDGTESAQTATSFLCSTAQASFNTYQMLLASSNAYLSINGVLQATKSNNMPTLSMQPFAYVRLSGGITHINYMEAYNT